MTGVFDVPRESAVYVRTYLPPDDGERASCERRLADRLTRPPPARRACRPDLLTLETADFERCVRAVAAYESQIGELFGSVEAYVEAARAYTALLDAEAIYAEREWAE